MRALEPVTGAESKGLFLFRMACGLQSPIPEVRLWSEISKFLGTSQSIVDRSALTTMPINMVVSPVAALPKRNDNFTKTYEQICNERAKEIFSLQDRIDKPIALLYSGGIDSTIVAVTMLKILGSAEFRKRVIIYMTQESIVENPGFYFNHLRKFARLESATLFKTLFDEEKIIVGAEFNDQLHGSLLLGNLIRTHGDKIINEDFSLGFLRHELVESGMTDEAVGLWLAYFEETLFYQCVGEVKSIFDFYWWLNFVYKWQSVYYRIPLRVLPDSRKKITAENLSVYYHHFFNTLDFQQWAMHNPQYRIKDSWATYKWHVKDLIYDFTKDISYRDQKLKVGSLYNLFLQSNNPVGLTSSYGFLYDINFDEYYNPNSNFKFSMGRR